MNYAHYPLANMRITQTYSGKTSHLPHNTGTPKDYPIDDGGKDTTDNDYFYCPCDEMVVKRVCTRGTNTFWLESTTPVDCADGTSSYITIMVTHCPTSELQKLKAGMKFTRYGKIAKEGKDGATGYHFHISVAKAKFSGTGWTKNSKGKYVLNGGVKPEDVFYIDPTVNTVIDNGGINFKQMPLNVEGTVEEVKTDGAKTKTSSISGTYSVTSKSGLRLRKGASTSKAIIGVLKYGEKVKCYGYHTGNWYYVSSSLGEGYVMKDYLKKV